MALKINVPRGVVDYFAIAVLAIFLAIFGYFLIVDIYQDTHPWPDELYLNDLITCPFFV